MKSITIGLLVAFFSVIMLTGCSKKMTCPAYNTTGNSKFYAGNPNNENDDKNNKADIEKQRNAELSGGKSGKKNKSYSLFPKWMGIKSH